MDHLRDIDYTEFEDFVPWSMFFLAEVLAKYFNTNHTVTAAWIKGYKPGSHNKFENRRSTFCKVIIRQLELYVYMVVVKTQNEEEPYQPYSVGLYTKNGHPLLCIDYENCIEGETTSDYLRDYLGQ